jgi:hypothetical protein
MEKDDIGKGPGMTGSVQQVSADMVKKRMMQPVRKKVMTTMQPVRKKVMTIKRGTKKTATQQ